ncbi:putative MAM1 protein [Sordaria sp. MPI-SDFR-AT-0083]|nr:putative MAM1 protein [Sordaria sp. MPI-SDFR-AT-0083]
MSRAQHDTHLLGLVDSDSEDGLSGPASTRFGSSKPATKTKPTSTITKPKSILKQTTTAAIIKKEPVNKPTAASTAKRATPKTATTKAATTTRQQSASGAGASTMAPAKRKTASTPSVANKRTAATTAVTASANKVIKASAQKTKPLTARQKAALARAALAESSGNVTATPSTVGKATRASGRGKRAAAAMAPVEEEEMESTEQTETILEEDTTMHDVTVTEEVEEAPKETTTRATRGRPRKTAVAETPVPATATATRGGRGRKKKVEELVVVEEDETTTTQQEEMTEEITHEETQIEEEEEESLPIPGAWRNGPAPASTSRKSSSLGLGFKAHTATGRNDDVELRRKLGEMTQKYEALELKYRDLKEVAVKEAERNFDKLRKHSEERTAASGQLIAALKDELSSKKEAARETTRLQKQLEASESQLSTLNAKVAELTSSLTKSKTEINALNIKLTASRQAEAAAAARIGQPQQVPGSAMKNKQNGNRMLTMGNSEAIAQATQQHQLKEDLYSDLTGLIVRGVKRNQQTGEDVYDCIQTGKNGTLHFKLAHISANTAHIDADETTQVFDEDQFHYMPQLDTNRDRALIDLLPDYLVEEITFPRQHAAKFYSRVNKALTETVAPQ